MESDKDNIVQAVVLMDTFNSNFKPITSSIGLLSIAGVPLLEFALESLSRAGVGETILFCCQDGVQVKEYLKESKARKAPWSWSMEVQVVMSDSCETLGDVLRELDAAAIVKGYFILMGVNTIANIPFASLLEQHKQTCKKDKGAAMTLVYKKLSYGHPLLNSNKPLFLAADGRTNKVLIHQKYKSKSKDRSISLPLETVLNHSEVKLHHNLADCNISICSPSVLPLFSDNFDFQTKEDFIYGILINEEILNSSLYYVLLKNDQYAASVTNWKTYRIICKDILHNWVHPLSIETGTYFQDKYVFMENNNYRNKKSTLARSCTLVKDVLVGENSTISDDTRITESIIGSNCVIGKNVTITGSHIHNNVTVKDNCRIVNSLVNSGSVINENSTLEGCVIAANVTVPPQSTLKDVVLESSDADKHIRKSTSESGTEWENESSGSEVDEFIGFDAKWSDTESYCSSASSDQSSLPGSPLPDDTNIFLQEVVDSLARGYEEKLKCDYLILEINSSRYAYNIQLHEVNFYVVRALLSLPILIETKNFIVTMKDVFKFFGPIVSNYIKTKSSVMDCLKAVEESCLKCDWLNGRAGQIVHFLYEKDIIDEDSVLEWQEDLAMNESPLLKQTSLVKFFEWLQEASEEESD